MITAPAVDSRAINFLESLTLPSGLTLGEAKGRDPWFADDVLTPVMVLDEAGLPVNRHAWIELHRGAGKTTLAAAISLTEAIRGAETEIIAIASDTDQARLLLEACDGFIRRSPRLAAAVRRTQSEFRVKANGSRIRVMSSDAPSFYGVGVACRRLRIIADEVGQWLKPDLWFAAISTLPKLADAQLLAITNAGLAGSWQAQAREAVAASGYLYAPPGVIASWITQSDLEAARAALPEPLYRRYYQNQWVSEVGAAIDAADWDACRSQIPPLNVAEPVIVGIDAGVASDYFAIVATSRARQPETLAPKPLHEVQSHPGWFDVLSPVTAADGSRGPEVWVRALKIWTPARGLPVDFSDPYRWLSQFVQQHNVVCCPFDEWQLYDFANRFGLEHSLWMEPFQQGPRRGQADTQLLQLIRAKRLRHDGDEQLREAALGAALKLSVGEDSKARFVKSHPAKKIDALVALSMSSAETLRLNL